MSTLHQKEVASAKCQRMLWGAGWLSDCLACHVHPSIIMFKSQGLTLGRSNLLNSSSTGLYPFLFLKIVFALDLVYFLSRFDWPHLSPDLSSWLRQLHSSSKTVSHLGLPQGRSWVSAWPPACLLWWLCSLSNSSTQIQPSWIHGGSVFPSKPPKEVNSE